MIHIWTADVYEGDMWSSQWISNLSNWNKEAWKKKSGLQRDSNPWPPRCRCDALPTELWSHTLGARSIASLENSLRRSHITFIYIRSSYMNHFIYITSFHSFHGKIWTHNWPRSQCVASSSSVGRASHRYRGGHGFESRWSPDFFSGFFIPIA